MQCDYEIVYRAGKSNGSVDSLTRRPGNLLEGRDERLKYIELVVLKQNHFLERLLILANDLPVQEHILICDIF
jgi:hypothetical protein